MWNDLSMRDRALLIRLAVSLGITNLDDILQSYNQLATGGPKDNKDIKQWVLDDMARRIEAVENDKSNKEGGWNARKGVWEPHTSVEGGANTIHYGIKLVPANKEIVDLVKKQGYITNDLGWDYLKRTRLSNDYDTARRTFNTYNKDALAWDSLSPKMLSILTDYQFNVGNGGLSVFKNLMNAAYNNDLEGLNREYKRYTGGLELTRNKHIKNELDSILNGFYNIMTEKPIEEDNSDVSDVYTDGKLMEYVKAMEESNSKTLPMTTPYNDGNIGEFVKSLPYYKGTPMTTPYNDGWFPGKKADGGKINKFAEGGPKEKDKSLTDNIRERLYYNITPRGYENAIPRLFDAVLDKRERSSDTPNLEALWAKYLGLNDEDFRSIYKDFPDDRLIQYPLYPHISDYVQESKYTPSEGKDKDAKYYSLAFPEISNWEIDQFFTSPDKRRQTQGYNDTMGTFTLTKGRDDKGDYISYYDKWDVSPFRGYGAKHDESLGIGKPVELYDRLYLDDYYNNPQSPADYWNKDDYYGGYLPEVIVTASGRPADEGLRGRVPTPDNIGLGTFGRQNPVNRFDGTSQSTQQMDRGNQPLYDGQIGFGFGYNPETFERYYTGFYNPYNNSYNNATWTDENNEYNIGLPAVTIRPSGESMVNRAQEKAAPVVRDVLLGSAALAGGIPALANAASKVPLSALRPGGAFWTNPLTVGTLAAEGINAGVKAVTPYNSVGDVVGSTLEKITGANPNNTWLGPIFTEAFNPGWYVSPTGIINTVGKIGGITELTLKDAINNTNLTKYKRLIFGNKHLPNIFKRMLGFPNEHLAPYEKGSAYDLNEYLSYLNYIKQKDIDILDNFFTEPKKGINLSKVTPPYLAWGNAHPNDPKILIRFTEGPFIGKPSIHKLGNWSSTNEPISLKIGDTPISGNMEIMKYTPGEIVHPISIAKNHSGFSRTVPFAGEYVPNGILENLPGSSVEIPIKNDDLFNQVLLDYIAQLEQKGYPVVGSTRTIAEGYHGGVPGDTEILVPKTMLDDAIEKFGFQKSRNTAGNTGITGHSDSAFVGKDGNAENLDINILDDTGPIIHEIESTRRPDVMPTIYDANARANAASGRLESTIIKSSDLKIPKEDGTFYTAKEYLDEIKNDKNLITQNVIDNIFKSNKEKHFKRAFTMMNSEDPRIITKVSTAIDHMVSQIPGMKRFSNLYKSQSFDNVEKNKEILKKIGFKPFDIDKFASNPELMKNIVDYWYMRKTVGTRSVNYSNKGGARENASLDEVMQAVRSFDNGSSAGGGGNEILGNKFGGYTRDYTSYNYHDPMLDKKTATFDDVFNYFERERSVWNDTDAVSNALTLSFKELGIKLPDNININFMNSNFTDIITDMIASGKITAKQGDDIIKRVSEKLGVSGYRGTSYGHNSEYGDYYGAMQRVGLSGENSNPLSTLRNIDSGTHNLPLAPAEWGTDNMFKIEDDGFKTRWNNIITKPLVVRDEFPKLTVEEAKKLYGSEGITDISDFYVYDSSGHVDALRTFDKYMTERKKILNDVKNRNDQLIKRKKDIAEKNVKSYDAHRRATNRLVSAKAFGTALGGFGGFALLLNTLYNNNLKKEAQYYMEEFPNIYPVLLKEGISKYPNNKEKAIKWAIRKINKTPESKLEEFVENKNELGNGGNLNDVGINDLINQYTPNELLTDGLYFDIMEQIAEQNYKDWGYDNSYGALTQALNDNVYNYRGYYNEFPNGDGNALDHWPDKYKTAYHPTFSDLSTYSGKVSEYNPTGRKGGHWINDNLYIPSVSWNNKFAKGGDGYNPRPVTTGGAGYIPTVSPNFINDVIFNISRTMMRLGRGNATYERNYDNSSDREPHESMAQATYLTPRNIQKEKFIKVGYTEAPKDYGLVKKAVGNRDIPVYQKRSDDEKRENLMPIGNLSNDWYGQNNARLQHPGSFPTTIYINPKNLKLYQKAWDLNDYGGGTGAYNGYLTFEKTAANFADKIGSPVVVTSGISKIDEENIEDDLLNKVLNPFMKSKGLTRYEDYVEEKIPMNNIHGEPMYNLDGSRYYITDKKPFTYYGLPEVTVYGKKKKKALGGNLFDGTSGLYNNWKSKGGKIYIKPSKRGTFTAAAKKHGKSVQAFASLVLANPSRYSAAMRKKANFARNAAKWR